MSAKRLLILVSVACIAALGTRADACPVQISDPDSLAQFKDSFTPTPQVPGYRNALPASYQVPFGTTVEPYPLSPKSDPVQAPAPVTIPNTLVEQRGVNPVPDDLAQEFKEFQSTQYAPIAGGPLPQQPTTSFSVVEPYQEFPSTDAGAFEATPQGFSGAQMEPFGAPAVSRTQVMPTPGHNERVNMNPDLSLTPPPIPGKAVKEYLPVQPPIFPAADQLPDFNPDVGHRSPMPTRRADTYSIDDGEKFGFETKKREFPPFGDIIATGRFFFMAEAMWAEPQFQGNTAIATEAVNFGESIANDFDSDFHPRFRFGFESPYGPGVEFSYFNINSNSEIASFTSDGIVTGQTNAWVIGRNVWSRILADDAGEVLSTQHSIDIDSAAIMFFKELKYPISRVSGSFGFQYASIAQHLNANVVSADGSVVESLRSVSDMRAFGPRAIMEYYRPIGHTPLELVTTFGGAVLFGERDQIVTNSQTGLENRLGADEFLTILDFLIAVQYVRNVGENRSWYGRFGFMNQTWIGGGTAAFPQGDFGLRGLTLGIGYNR